jgi:CheY-like chemotaxis protein
MPHVLVVHDFPAIGRMCQVHLERAGYTVALATDGGTAWELLQKSRFNLILSDIILPVCDGWQLYA